MHYLEFSSAKVGVQRIEYFSRVFFYVSYRYIP